MKCSLLLVALALFGFNVLNAQTLLTCSGSKSGAKVSFVSKSGQDITLRVDWDEGSTFMAQNLGIVNGTCQDCPRIGGIGRPHGTFKNWKIRQTNLNQPVTIAWATQGTINYCGGSAPATIPGTGITALECLNDDPGLKKITFVSKQGQDIRLKVDWKDKRTMSGAGLDITNGTCKDCPRVGGIGSPHGTSKTYIILQADPNKPVTITWKNGGGSPVTNYCTNQYSPIVVPAN